MIPVVPQPEPGDFDMQVRQPGRRWLQKNPQAKAEDFPPHWRRCLGDLHTAYEGICAYVCVYIEPITGAQSVDHFVAKSPHPGLAYEWSNYRLACARMNARKREFEDVLDPFDLSAGTFWLVLSTGQIKPTALQGSPEWQVADASIQRLGLDDEDCRKLRGYYFKRYRQEHISAEFLNERAPVVYQEVVRQGKLREKRVEP